ncbi:hypothetical protein A5649_01760 [Mycolicibacter heraklionensis]|uniref:PE-PGRS family protein n=1 Tax=Mycolicibacter heraklionensis TaxID=512402 RepID=A0AA91EV39_9MYCO|nr:hypothetical protein [Mycolicibacter heraklionensis]OBK85778.1 hypothetical protein A5649_01760 [Mycolicibacter heraklionensis]
MQLAMAAGSTDRGTAFNTRATGLLAAGVALAGAGVIAVNPVAPMISAAAHQPAVELTATTGENLDHIMDLLTGPNPVFTALGELGSYYGETTSNSIQGVLDGLEIMWSGGGRVIGLETLLPQVAEFLQQGDFLNAWNLLNNDMLYNLNGIFQPLFDHTVRGTGEFVPGVMGIGADMTNVWAAVQEIFGDFNFWKTTAKYMIEPLTGFAFALSENLTGVPDGVEHTLQDPFDALLNGYITWDSETGEDTGQWWGLLTENGTLSYFLDFLPGKFADALTSTIPVPEVDVDPGDAAAAASLLDFGWLDSLFN